MLCHIYKNHIVAPQPIQPQIARGVFELVQLFTTLYLSKLWVFETIWIRKIIGILETNESIEKF